MPQRCLGFKCPGNLSIPLGSKGERAKFCECQIIWRLETRNNLLWRLRRIGHALNRQARHAGALRIVLAAGLDQEHEQRHRNDNRCERDQRGQESVPALAPPSRPKLLEPFFSLFRRHCALRTAGRHPARHLWLRLCNYLFEEAAASVEPAAARSERSPR